MKNLLLLLFTLSFALAQYANAAVKLPRLLSDGLILQRETPNTIWGWASPNEKISVSVDGKTFKAKASTSGDWSVKIPAYDAGGPYTISVEGENTLTIKDVYFGDVWVASGQSNMQTTLNRIEERYPDLVANANDPLIREFTVPREMNFKGPQKDITGGEWQASVSDKIGEHSAVAYFFAKKIQEKQNVPVGILGANFGGSPAECWISRDDLKQYPAQYKSIENFDDDGYLQSIKDADQQESNAWFAKLNGGDKGMQGKVKWYENSYDDDQWKSLNMPSVWADEGIEPMTGIVWFRKEITLPDSVKDQDAFLRLGVIVDGDTAYINGEQVGSTGYRYPPRRYKVKPGVVKPGKNIITLRVQVDNGQGEFVSEKPYYLQVGDTKIDLKGEWKYKVANVIEPPKPKRFIPWNEPLGCYNAMLAPLFNMNIKGVIWYQGESNTGNPQEYATLFPHLIKSWRRDWNQGDFPFLFVQLANYMSDPQEPSESQWAATRFAQFQTLDKVDNTAMAVISDVGEWNDLHPLNKKAVGERLALAAEALAYGNTDIEYSGPLFKNLERKKNKLIISFDHVGDGLIAKDGKLGGFAIAGEDGKYVWAKAKIKKGKVVVWSKEVKNPVSVRYAWANDPNTANLYNKNGLPASVFEATVN
ncbi:sialate O-acetylesterase [Teredinibacter turnerae]|uniref:sialate O-acetylesterase n=1 Tax=Teredinibacter turnerae TaxID=2426 RepID=UPI0003794C67|nr:sialate O-acetylesterase [Teredinibacter turnerae]